MKDQLLELAAQEAMKSMFKVLFTVERTGIFAVDVVVQFAPPTVDHISKYCILIIFIIQNTTIDKMLCSKYALCAQESPIAIKKT